jgi:hypothetical protein
MKKLLILIGISLFTSVCQAQLSFSESAQTLGSTGFACLSGDLNNDGNLDIYIVKRDKPDEIWFNDGKGAFTISEQKIGNTVKYNQNAALADLNGDGALDIFIANDADWNHTPSIGLPNEVWLNDGKGKFTDSGQRLGNEASHDIALGDVDGDGDIDAVLANLHSTDLANTTYQANEVWLNDGKGNFTKSSQTLGIGGCIVKLTDLDSDTDLDVVIQIQASGSFVIWLNDGKGNFTQSAQTAIIGTNIAFGDVDGDGDKDAFVVKGTRTASAPCEVWLNDGAGLFANSNQSLGNKTGYFVDLGDVDGDGDLDAMVTNGLKDAQASSLWINKGGKQGSTPGTFIESGIVFSATQIGNVNSGDFDKDGDIDLVISNYAGTNKIYFNNTISTGINKIENKTSMYLNPNNGKLILKFGDIACKKASVNIYNTNGVLVLSKISQNASYVDIDLSGNPQGVYFAQLTIDGNMRCQKLSLIY